MNENKLVSIIKESADDDIIKVDKKNKEIEIIGENNNERNIQKYKEYNNTYDLKICSTKKLENKSDYYYDIKELYREGYTQNEIANRLGISQSYVSKLLSSYKIEQVKTKNKIIVRF